VSNRTNIFVIEPSPGLRSRDGLPAVSMIIATAGEHASIRFLEFFAVNIRNPHTRRAVADFMAWCGNPPGFNGLGS